MKKQKEGRIIHYIIFFISLLLFLSDRCLVKPIMASEDDERILTLLPVAGSQANQNNALDFQPHKPHNSQFYRNRLSETHEAQEILQKKIWATLRATYDLVRKIKLEIEEKRMRLPLPDLFIKALNKIKIIEPYELFDDTQLLKAVTQFNEDNLAPLTNAIEHIDNFFRQWDIISSSFQPLMLAIGQSLEDQTKWGTLFSKQTSHKPPYDFFVIKACDFFQWVEFFHTTLEALKLCFDGLEQKWQEIFPSTQLPQSLLCLKVELTNYYHEKNALLWEIGKPFLKTLPEYDSLPENFFLQQNAYEWIRYFSSLGESWPTSKNWHQEEWIEIISLAEKIRSSLENADDLTTEDKEKIQQFWKDNGKKIWNLLKECLKNLPEYDHLLDTLYPDVGDFEKGLTYKKLINVLKVINLLGQSINIPENLSGKLTKVFSPSQEWEQKIKHFKIELKKFTNIRFIIKRLPGRSKKEHEPGLKDHYQDFKSKYQENFGKTYDPFMPVACVTTLDGKSFILPQSSACTVFPSLYLEQSFWLDTPFDSHHVSIPPIQGLHYHETPMNVGEEYMWCIFERLFGVPSTSPVLLLFKNILIHKPSQKILVPFGSEFGIRSRHSDSNPDKINHQREIRFERSLRNPEEWKTSPESAFVLMQEQFKGILLSDFLKEGAKGKPVSFKQLDVDSIHRQMLLMMSLRSFVPLENWGLIEQDGKLVLMRIRGDGKSQDQPFLYPQSTQQNLKPNVLHLLPFEKQPISATVREELLALDSSLILSHLMAELTKIQRYFDDLLKQKTASSKNQLEAIKQDQDAWGLKIHIFEQMIWGFILNFEKMKKFLWEPITYPALLNKIRPDEFMCNKFILRNLKEDTRLQEREAFFFKNVLLTAISELDATRFSHEKLIADANCCYIDSGYYPEWSIETLLNNKIESAFHRYLFLSIYESVKDGCFFEAQKILNTYEHLKNQKNLEFSSYSQNTLLELPSAITKLISYADLSGKDCDQQIEILSELLALQPDLSNPPISWQLWYDTIDWHDPVFGRKALTMSPDLRKFLGRSCKNFPILVDPLFKGKIALEEFKQYDSRLSLAQKKHQDEKVPETVAANLFYGIWGEEDDPLLHALLDLLLLPRYAALGTLPKDLQHLSGYLASTGFASHPLSSQHEGRSKSSHSGPVTLERGDHQYYNLSWSERWVKFFKSLETIPAWIRERILAQDADLLSLKWKHKLQEAGINITLYPGFAETLPERIRQMQQLIIDQPLCTFSAVMEGFHPAIFAVHQHQFVALRDTKTICSYLENLIKQRHDLITLNSSDINWDWIPTGKDKNLELILEEMNINSSGSSLPLSIKDAAAQDFLDFMNQPYVPSVAEKILEYIGKFGIDSHNLPVNQVIIKGILKNLIQQDASREAIQGAVSLLNVDLSKKQPELFNQLIEIAPQENIKAAIEWYLEEAPDEKILELINPQSSLETQKLVITLYLRCSMKGIDIQKDSLKISGTPSAFKKLNRVIRYFPHIVTLDISDNALDSLGFCSFGSSCNEEGFLKFLPKLTTLIISDNPVYDLTPLRKLKSIKNIIFSNTYAPGGMCFEHLMRFGCFASLSSGEVESVIQLMKNKQKAIENIQEINNAKAIINLKDSLNANQMGRVIDFYKDLLISIKRTHTPNLSGDDIHNMKETDKPYYNAYYYGIVANIVDQIAQTFWHETLADEQFLPAIGLGNHILFNYLKNALTSPLSQASEACQKWLFALENHLPPGIPPEDLVWNENKGTYFLKQLNIAKGTAEYYLNCLLQHWEFLIKNQELMDKKAWHINVITLAADQLGKNFWKEALTVKGTIIPKELLQVLTFNDASIEARKLAFAWQCNLPPETNRDSLYFAPTLVDTVKIADLYQLTTLSILGADFSKSCLEFLSLLSHLTKLELIDCGLTTAEFLPDSINIKELNLSRNKIVSLWGLYNKSKIFKFFKLDTLKVPYNLIDFDVKTWEGFRKSISFIKEVDMSYNKISITPVMTPYPIKKSKVGEKNTSFKIDHNNISNIHQLYDFKFFWKREKEDFKSIIPKNNNHHPIHIFYEDGKLLCQIYNNSNLREYKLPWDISTCQSPIVERLNNLHILKTFVNIIFSEEDKKSLVTMIINSNPGYLNTVHLYVTPQNDQL